VEESRNIVRALGSSRRTVSAAEEAKKLKFRRSIVLRQDLPQGHVLTENDLVYKRPGTGIRPDESRYVIGRTLKRALFRDQVLNWSDLA
ncbi:MAG: SAF domain-containing protein, partial [Candidatus Margulisiibacteriota bacterium]